MISTFKKKKNYSHYSLQGSQLDVIGWEMQNAEYNEY